MIYSVWHKASPRSRSISRRPVCASDEGQARRRTPHRHGGKARCSASPCVRASLRAVCAFASDYVEEHDHRYDVRLNRPWMSLNANTPPLRVKSSAGKSSSSRKTQSYCSGGTRRFFRGQTPLSQHFRAWITKWSTTGTASTTSAAEESEDTPLTTEMNCTSCSYESWSTCHGEGSETINSSSALH